MELIARKSLLLSVLLFSQLLYAEWQGPEVLIESSWGDGDNEFGMIEGDTVAFDVLPGPYDISEAGNIVMADMVNGRFKVFNSSYELTALHTPPPIDKTPNYWRIVPVFIGENISLILDEYYFYNLSGELFTQVASPKKARFRKNINNVLYLYQKKPLDQWVAYSSNGELLETFSQKPLVLGRMTDDMFVYGGDISYNTTVTYDDKSLTIADRPENLCEHFDRDINGNVYCVRDEKVTRFNNCGKPASVLTIPEDDITIRPSGMPGIEDDWTINSEYMSPKVDNQGNVYAVRRTPANYSLVKWTWQDSANDSNDGPDAPINVTLKAIGTSAVELTWEGSLQDPGCVTGYQVLRTDTPGGAATVVANPNKSVKVAIDASVETGNTYYYTVKALSAIGDSEPSSEVSITIE